MPATAKLNDIVEVLELQLEETPSFFDCETGRVETIPLDLMHKAEEPDDSGDENIIGWQKKPWELAKLIVSSPPGRFLDLPSKFDVHEWAIMQEFAGSVKSGSIREDLMHAIHGPGAFRNFKYHIRRHGIEKTWYAFHTDALRQIAIDWCEKHRIAWE